MAQTYFVVPEQKHNALTEAVYRRRGFLPDEAADGARLCADASRHGIRTGYYTDNREDALIMWRDP